MASREALGGESIDCEADVSEAFDKLGKASRRKHCVNTWHS